MITAKEARELSGPTIAERIEELDPMIRAAAINKRRDIHVHDDWWTSAGYGQSSDRKGDWLEACNQLRELGYKVEFFYEELQFVNMYVIVSW